MSVEAGEKGRATLEGEALRRDAGTSVASRERWWTTRKESERFLFERERG